MNPLAVGSIFFIVMIPAEMCRHHRDIKCYSQPRVPLLPGEVPVTTLEKLVMYSSPDVHSAHQTIL